MDRDDPYMQMVSDKIDEYGVMIQAVAGEQDESSFCYTVGLREIGSPEALMAGLPMQVAHSLLNTVHERVKGGERLVLGYEFNELLAGGYRMMVCAVTDEHEANVSRVFYGHDVAVVQLVFQDKNHHYPWELEYDTDPRVQKNWFVAPATN